MYAMTLEELRRNLTDAVTHPTIVAGFDDAINERNRLRQALHEICEEWAGAECGEPVTAQEGYAIWLAKKMYQIAADATAPPNNQVQRAP